MGAGVKLLSAIGKPEGLVGGQKPTWVPKRGRNPAFSYTAGANEAGVEGFFRELDSDFVGKAAETAFGKPEDLQAPGARAMTGRDSGDFQPQFDMSTYSPWLKKYKRPGLLG